jgi:hypothetical protein
MAAMAFVELVPVELVQTLYNHSNRSFHANFKIILLFQLIQIHRQFKQIWCTHITDLHYLCFLLGLCKKWSVHRIVFSVHFYRFIVSDCIFARATNR